MKKPSIGRIVHYRTEDFDVEAAIITDVMFDGSVHLSVIGVMSNEDRKVFNVHEGPGVGQWSWPPRET